MTNVVAFPTHRTVQLLNLNGQVVFSAGFPVADRDPGAPWAWIQETVAHELSVREDDVGCADSEEGDFVTVEGIRVYQITWVRRPLFNY